MLGRGSAGGVRAGIGVPTGSGIGLVGSDPHSGGPDSADGSVINSVGSSLPVSTGSVMSSVGSSEVGPVRGGRSSRCVVSASAAGLGDGRGRGRDGLGGAGVRGSGPAESEVASRTGQTIAVVSSAGDLRGGEGAGGVAGGVLVGRSDWGESGAGEFGSDMLVSGPFAMAYTRKSRGPDATASGSRHCLLPAPGDQCPALSAIRLTDVHQDGDDIESDEHDGEPKRDCRQGRGGFVLRVQCEESPTIAPRMEQRTETTIAKKSLLRGGRRPDR